MLNLINQFYQVLCIYKPLNQLNHVYNTSGQLYFGNLTRGHGSVVVIHDSAAMKNASGAGMHRCDTNIHGIWMYPEEKANIDVGNHHVGMKTIRKWVFSTSVIVFPGSQIYASSQIQKFRDSTWKWHRVVFQPPNFPMGDSAIQPSIFVRTRSAPVYGLLGVLLTWISDQNKW